MSIKFTANEIRYIALFENMTGAMYAAIAGMKTHMNKLSVIGNNGCLAFGSNHLKTLFH